ncbi:MAG: hypothetical protein A2391_00525 [Candidatus Brennerbacteria bacterium RIFOXYB1_FULL_41_13]|nr:MAG: hypothetical protein A2391_00525 [Candidatus Brennerbacteria bacterium RIFOXYB1_FULL_41_13]
MKSIVKKKAGFVLWQDAVYSDRKKYPGVPPFIDVSFGIISQRNKEFITVGMNCNFDKEKKYFEITDGIVIPRRSIIKIVYLENFNDWKEIK